MDPCAFDIVFGPTMNPQLAELAPEHALVRMDMRGWGQSSVPGSSMYRHCDDVAAVVDALGSDRVVVAGYV